MFANEIIWTTNFDNSVGKSIQFVKDKFSIRVQQMFEEDAECIICNVDSRNIYTEQEKRVFKTFNEAKEYAEKYMRKL